MESDVEKYLRGEVKKLGGLALKFISPSMNGVPDRIVLLPGGRIFFVELKAKGQKARPLQLAVHRVFNNLGHNVYVLDSKEKVKEWFNGI